MYRPNITCIRFDFRLHLNMLNMLKIIVLTALTTFCMY